MGFWGFGVVDVVVVVVVLKAYPGTGRKSDEVASEIMDSTAGELLRRDTVDGDAGTDIATKTRSFFDSKQVQMCK